MSISVVFRRLRLERPRGESTQQEQRLKTSHNANDGTRANNRKLDFDSTEEKLLMFWKYLSLSYEYSSVHRDASYDFLRLF